MSRRSCLGGLPESGFGLHQDGFGQLFTEAEAGVTDLTDHHALLAQAFDALVFAEAHFTDSAGYFRGGEYLADAAYGAWANFIQGANEAVEALFCVVVVGGRVAHLGRS